MKDEASLKQAALSQGDPDADMCTDRLVPDDSQASRKFMNHLPCWAK